MDITALASALIPARTTLLFGAGASIPSGAPSGRSLASRLARLVDVDLSDVELAEVAQIVENRKGRPALTAAIREALRDLQPTAGLLALPQFDWQALYTTNYDTLVEQSYRAFGKDLLVYKSNYDISSPRGAEIALYKIHGCITQDAVDGHKSRMLITDSDYDDFEKYRQTLFNALASDMYTSDTVIIGQSLRDRHLKDLARRVTGLRSQGVTSRIYLLVHEYDSDRAELFTRYGLDVVGGTLDDLLRALVVAGKTATAPVYSTSTDAATLTPDLVLDTIDVAHARGLESNAIRLFDGAPASYADIRAGLTIVRVAQGRLEDAFRGARGYFLVVEGARGVGKTTLARALMLGLPDRSIEAWEHRSDQQLQVEQWLGVERRLRLGGRDGVLLVDDCARNLRGVNDLVSRLAVLDRPHLRVVVTVDSAKWRVAAKSPAFFSRGTTLRLSLLERSDIEQLVGLVERNPDVRRLVEADFLSLSRPQRVSRLRDKCSRDMFVCLKNIFASSTLDEILLQEYFSLGDEEREVYRYVAAVQSFGGYVHRQLIMRVLGMDATAIGTTLARLDGVISERIVEPRRGIYGWSTRHDVIAGVIARLKFAEQRDLVLLFEALIDGLNPSVRIELETAVALATEDAGISRVADSAARVALFRRLIDVVPNSRTPRRRLVRMFLGEGQLAAALNEIRAFEKALGTDVVLDRYKAVAALKRAESITGVEDADRKAILLDGSVSLRQSMVKHGAEVHGVFVLGELGLALAERFGEFDVIDEAIELLVELEVSNGDPAIPSRRRALQKRLRALGSGSDAEQAKAEESEELDLALDSAGLGV